MVNKHTFYLKDDNEHTFYLKDDNEWCQINSNAASKPCKDVPAGPEVPAVPSAGVGSTVG